MADEHALTEETLDPQDWGAMRTLAHRMVDDMLDYLQTVRERPVWQPTPEDVQAQFNGPLPLEPQDPEKVYEEFTRYVLPYPTGNIHPRFWGWVMGTGSPFAMLADMLASGINPNMGGAAHASNKVEEQVIAWCKAMFGFPAGASGLLVSGGSMANLVGLTVARNVKAGYDIRAEGVQRGERMLIVYASTEAHSSIQRAVELLGLGNSALRKIPVDAKFRIQIDALEAAIAQDRAGGHQPICIVGNAGTVNTGAFDDLSRLAEISGREGLWFHVDGAFGAWAALAPGLRPLVDGMEKADSLAFDLHKWGYLPFEVGCALVRSEADHRRTFTLRPDYLAPSQRGLAGGSIWFSDYGIQLTRGFRALKVWMGFKAAGLAKLARLIQQNVDQAQYLRALVENTPALELLADVPLNIVCFRYRAAGLDDGALDRLNDELLLRLQESGAAAPSGTRINDKYAIRVCITNHRSRREDFDVLVREVVQLGETLAKVMAWQPEKLHFQAPGAGAIGSA